MGHSAVVLISGGMDSAVCMAIACEQHGPEHVYPLWFDYGQTRIERIFAERFLTHLYRDLYGLRSETLPSPHGWREPLKIVRVDDSIWDQNDLTSKFCKGGKSKRFPHLPASFVPGRNMVFLALGASYAARFSPPAGVWIGTNTVDYSGYPDCRNEFLNQMDLTIRAAISEEDTRTRVFSPLQDLNKVEILESAAQLGILDLVEKHTYSCYGGELNPCRKCESCEFRDDAFRRYYENRT